MLWAAEGRGELLCEVGYCGDDLFYLAGGVFDFWDRCYCGEALMRPLSRLAIRSAWIMMVVHMVVVEMGTTR